MSVVVIFYARAILLEEKKNENPHSNTEKKAEFICADQWIDIFIDKLRDLLNIFKSENMLLSNACRVAALGICSFFYCVFFIVYVCE